MGLWHGATAGYLLWGGFWGTTLVVWRLAEDGVRARPRLRALTSRADLAGPLAVAGALLTFHLFALSLPLITVEPGKLGALCRTLVAGTHGPRSGRDAFALLYYASPVALMQAAQVRTGSLDPVAALSLSGRAGVYAILVALMIVSGATHGEEFVYFRF